MSGPLGRRVADLLAIAGTPPDTYGGGGTLCRHAGLVFIAAIPLTIEQLLDAAQQADHLSRRETWGLRRPWNTSYENCPSH